MAHEARYQPQGHHVSGTSVQRIKLDISVTLIARKKRQKEIDEANDRILQRLLLQGQNVTEYFFALERVLSSHLTLNLSLFE